MTERISSYTENDTAPALSRTTFKGDVIDLTGATLKFRLQREDGSIITKTITIALNADGQITDAANCEFNFLWVAGDLQRGNGQEGEIELDLGGIQTEGPIYFDVRGEVG